MGKCSAYVNCWPFPKYYNSLFPPSSLPLSLSLSLSFSPSLSLPLSLSSPLSSSLFHFYLSLILPPPWIKQNDNRCRQAFVNVSLFSSLSLIVFFCPSLSLFSRSVTPSLTFCPSPPPLALFLFPPYLSTFSLALPSLRLR